MRKAPGSRLCPGVSRGTIAALLLAAPGTLGFAGSAAAGSGPPSLGGFAGSAVVAHGSATISVANGVQTISIPTNSPVTTLNWTPTDTATGGGAIDFLPLNHSVSYVGAAGATAPYHVLNRIIATDQSRNIAFNGAITSTANTRVWFYAPGGLLIGPTATFDVGGLVLTAADPVTDEGGNFITTGTDGVDRFSVTGAAGSTSAITIQPGASIKALNPGQSNYIVAIAPQIAQGGTIAVGGAVALVAAESASFAVDSHGLFNISVSAGTTVANNTFVHTGSTGGPNADPSGNFQRVYMVAVPKNNAIAMAIASSGSIGFAVADAAKVDGNAIVLSAGSNIADSGVGNPVVAGRAGTGTAGLTVGAGTYNSATYAVSTDTATVTDPALGIGFAANLAVVAPQATVNAQVGTIAIGGNLTVDASDTRTGNGGTAQLLAAGTVAVTGETLVTAAGTWSNATLNNGNTATTGGTALVSVTGGLRIGGALTVSAGGDGSGSYAALAAPGYNPAASATGGTATVTVSGGAASLTAANGITVSADALSGNQDFGYGGTATGGTAALTASAGGTIGTGVIGGIGVSANANPTSFTPTDGTTSQGGYSVGGSATIVADAGTITVGGVAGISALANAFGGAAPSMSGSGGTAVGGTALIATRGATGKIATNITGQPVGTESASYVEAFAQGGDASGFFASDSFSGGSATGGTATVQVGGTGQSIAIDGGASLTIDVHATGGAGFGDVGGLATGGLAQILASGAPIAFTNTQLQMNASAVGGADNIGTLGNGGNAAGGTVRIAASGGGTIDADVATYATASATAGAGSGNGGNALGGNIFVALGNNDYNFGGTAQSAEFDASFTAGSALIGTGGTAASAGGVLLTDLGTATLGGKVTIDGNTQLYVQAGGGIAVPGSITGSGAGAYLHLWADDLGSGTGTVTVAKGALNLPGNLIDIYYNPAALGTPTDYSAGIGAGTATAYQLVDNVDQLQLVGSYLAQNFALGKNIDASATQGWNGGAGFVPIGNLATPFVGNFDGLSHTIFDLNINTPDGNGTGLFSYVGAGVSAHINLRNIGLIDPQVTGSGAVGALIGTINLDDVTVSNSFTTGGLVSGISDVGGLIGISNSGSGANSIILVNLHSDTNINSTVGPAGGLIGYFGDGTISQVYATGTVTSGSGAGVGGLIGYMPGGSLSHAYASGNVAASDGGKEVGGLIGASNGTISQVYAVGNVTAAGDSEVGGLVGTNGGTINEGWSSGNVSASNSSNVGGFVGYNYGQITNSYWDSYTAGQTSGVGLEYGTTNLNPVTSDPSAQGAYAFSQSSYTNFTAANWTYDNGLTRPVGAWETPVAQFEVARIASAHQVQLIDYNLAGNYQITQSIDMRGTGGTSDIWGPGGFMPLGHAQIDPPFTGTLDGAGHVLANLTIASGSGFFPNIGLIQQNYGTIRDIGLANVAISDRFAQYTGALAGVNAGQISGSFATGTIALDPTGSAGPAGGLVGLNADGVPVNGYFLGYRGTITQSYATVAVSGTSGAGGLVGDNEGGIDQSYANGKVSGNLTGGLVGQSTDLVGPTVTKSYWDSQATGQDLGCGTTGYDGACSGLTGLTTAQTLQSASFIGFTIDTLGGQGLPWRQYEGNTTPLLAAFLTPISVQPASLTMQYTAAAPVIAVTTYGAQPALTFGAARVDGVTSNAGVSYLTYGGGLYSTQLGYDFAPSSSPGTLVITQAPLTLTATTDTRGYNATTGSGGTVQVAGLLGEDGIFNLSQSFASPNVLGANGSTLVVNPGYFLNDRNNGGNYAVTFVNAPGTITPAALTLAAVTDTRVYNGTASSTGVPQAVGLFGNDSVASLTQSFTSPNAMGPNGSTLVVNPGYVVNDGNGGANYTVTLQNAAGTITAAELMLTLAAVSDTRVYDGTTNSAETPQTIGLINQDSVSNLTQSFTSPNVMGAGGSTLVIDPGYVVHDGNNGNNYRITLQTAPGTITAAPLGITYSAAAASSIYGAAIAGLTGSVGATGLQGKDTLAAVTSGTVAFATTATAQSNVGSYAITGAGLGGNSSNYSFSFVQAPGNATALTVVARALTLTADPLSRVYGAANPASDTASAAGATATTGLVNGDSIGSVAVTSPATVASGVGNYALTGAAAQFATGTAANYAIIYAANQNGLAITPAPLTLTYTATPLSLTYGQAPAGLTGSIALTGLVNNDAAATVTRGTAAFTSPATAASNVGAYAIAGAGVALASANYALTSVQAPGNATALAITPAAATIIYTATPLSSIYGDTPAGLSGTASALGLLNNDTVGSVTSGIATFATTATAQSNVGSYAITGSGLTASSGNYNFSFAQAPGNPTALTIAARGLTLTADPLSRVYGGTNPTGDTATATAGLVNGDTVTSETVNSPATSGADVGSYGLNGANAQFGTGQAANYVITYAPNPNGLTITPAPLTLTYTANAGTATYGQALVGLTGTTALTGLVNDDTAAGLTTGTALFTSPATAASNVGAYAIAGSGIALASTNYALTSVQAPGNAAALTIVPRPITVTADPQSRAVGSADPLFTYVVTGPAESTTAGLVNGDTLTGQLASTATTTSPAGAYDILQGTLAASANYRLTYVGNVLTVTFPQFQIEQITNPIATNLPFQTGSSVPDERRKQQDAALAAIALAGQGVRSLQITQSMINDRLVTTPPPVNEPVTSNGNSSLWSPVP